MIYIYVQESSGTACGQACRQAGCHACALRKSYSSGCKWAVAEGNQKQPSSPKKSTLKDQIIAFFQRTVLHCMVFQDLSSSVQSVHSTENKIFITSNIALNKTTATHSYTQLWQLCIFRWRRQQLVKNNSVLTGFGIIFFQLRMGLRQKIISNNYEGVTEYQHLSASRDLELI